MAWFRAVSLGLATALLAAPSVAQPSVARARLIDPAGKPVGDATIEEGPNGLLVQLRVFRLDPGLHGFHLHAVGNCEPPDFKSASGHFNPEGHDHGFMSGGRYHAGDLPNLVVGVGRKVSAEAFVPGVTLRSGEKALLDEDGAALVIHAKADDHRSDPAGDAGDRVACGVIEQ